MEYDKSLLKFITEQCPKKASRVLEVAVGTGYPFADYLSNGGYEVHGIDLSPDLIRECSQFNPHIHCKVGDAEHLEYADSFFDFAYCVHSSWYIPDLQKAIREMMRVVRPGGGVLFDVQNVRNAYIYAIYRKHIFHNTHWAGMAVKTARNFVKFVSRRGIQDWPFVVSEVPSDPVDVIRYLKETNPQRITVMARVDEGALRVVEDETANFPDRYQLFLFHY